MKQTLFLLVQLLFVSLACSQNDLPAFGKPLLSELQMKTCSFDSTANAVKLLDYQEKQVIIDYGLKIKTERRVKLKILNKEGFDHATISIPYISRIKGTKITDLTAYHHYLDEAGNIVTEKLDKKQIFREKTDDEVKKLKFTFPNLKVGCVVEYRYEKTEKNSFHLDQWFFQDLIPTSYSAFLLRMPADIHIDYRVRGVDSITEKIKRDKDWIYGPDIVERLYAHSNVPAFRPEPLMTSISDNLQRVEFAYQPSFLGSATTTNKWKRIASLLYNTFVFGGQFKTAIPGTEKIIDSAKQLSTTEEKINYIFQRVKRQVKWDEVQTFYPGNIADAWKNRDGNSAEINIIILNLLDRAGIPCSPVLISTRDNGLVDADFYSMSQFNGIDILVKDSTRKYILDGTQKNQSYKTPPSNIMNRYVFNFDTANVSWFIVSDDKPLLKTTLMVNADLTEKGTIEGFATMMSYDHSKSARLEEINKAAGEQKAEEKEFISKDFTGLKIDSLNILDAEDDLAPLTESFVFSYEPSSTGEFLFLDPFFLSNFRKNPFSDSKRHTDIDFNSMQLLLTNVNINIPDTYEISSLPKDTRMRTEDSSILFSRMITVHNNTIYFSNKMEVLYALFDKQDYHAIQDFFTRMYGLIAEQIVLKKK